VHNSPKEYLFPIHAAATFCMHALNDIIPYRLSLLQIGVWVIEVSVTWMTG